jgi:hypothetical protein
MVESDGSVPHTPPTGHEEERSSSEEEAEEEQQESEQAEEEPRTGVSFGSEQASLLPNNVPGDLSRWIVASTPTTASVVSGIAAEMKEYVAITEKENGGSRLFNRAIAINSGSFAFLTVPTVHPGSECLVEVVHCTKEFILPLGHASKDDAVNQTIVFLGESQLQQLPKLLLQPSTGLNAAVIPSEAHIPSSDTLMAFYKAKDTEDTRCTSLVPRRSGITTDKRPLPRWMFIPTAFVPWLIEGLPPRTACDRLRVLIGKLPPSLLAMFGPLMRWSRAACMQQGGTGPQRASSQMTIKWRAPRMTASLTNWAVRQMRSHYPEIYEAATVGPAAPPATNGNAFDSTTIREAIRDGISAGATNMAAVMRPLEEGRARKDKWSELQKEAVLKSCGYPSSTDWDFEARPTIWEVYEEEGCKPQDIIRVFRKEFNPDADDVTTDIIEPFITLHLAKDIRQCSFEHDGTLTYDNCDRGIVPLAVLPRTAQEQSAILEDEEVYDEVNIRTEEVVRARSQRAQPKKAPRDLAGLVTALRAYLRVVEVHFGPLCSLRTQVRQLVRLLQHRRREWELFMTSKTCALVIWHVTMKARQFFKAPYDDAGNPPKASLLYLITQLENMQEPSAMNMPLALIDRPAAAASVRIPAYATMGAEDQLFGGDGASTLTGGTRESSVAANTADTFVDIVHKNSGVEPRFRDLFQTVKGYYPFFRMGRVCQHSKDPPFRLRDIIIKDDHCLDYMVVGHCRNPKCAFQHTTGCKPDEASVPNFLEKVVPVLAAMVEAAKQRAAEKKSKKRRRS